MAKSIDYQLCHLVAEWLFLGGDDSDIEWEMKKLSQYPFTHIMSMRSKGENEELFQGEINEYSYLFLAEYLEDESKK